MNARSRDVGCVYRQLAAILITAAIGVIDEAIQLALPHRVFDPVDMLFNTLAAVSAVAAGLVLARMRRSVRA